MVVHEPVSEPWVNPPIQFVSEVLDIGMTVVQDPTAEDPIEYNFTGVNQCQVNEMIGLSFANILRSMLRQAPNIILVGEIRDYEVAEVAIQAALTGHLVFSTLHTNDAPSAITRLIDMGVKPFLVAKPSPQLKCLTIRPV